MIGIAVSAYGMFVLRRQHFRMLDIGKYYLGVLFGIPDGRFFDVLSN